MFSGQDRLMAAVPVVLEAVVQLQLLLEQDDQEEKQMVVALIGNVRAPNQQQPQVFTERILPSFIGDQFREHFRLSSQTYEFVFGEIGRDLERIKDRANNCSPDKQLLIALCRFATPHSYRSIDLRFGVAKATGIKAVDQLSRALVKIAYKYITWPTGEQAIEVAYGFAMAHGYPGIIGAIDGAHINIIAPSENPEAYVNTKSKHSIQCQLVKVYFGQVGSLHNARVFRLSPVSDFVPDTSKFNENTHIIGDSTYALGKHVMVPYTDNGHLTRQQKNFNFCHSSARMVIERTNGLLKGRWRSLLHCLAMTRVFMIPFHVMTRCVLHNISYDSEPLEDNQDGPEQNPHHINHFYFSWLSE